MVGQAGIAREPAASAPTEPRARCFTVDEYYRMAESGILGADDRVELVEGEIIEMAPIGDGHAGDTDYLTHSFVTGLAGRAIVRVQGPLRISPKSEPVPDLQILRPDANFYRAGHPSPHDVLLLIEVSDSTLSYDRGRKLVLYAAAGIEEVWIVDLQGGRVLVYRAPREGEYSQMIAVGRDGSVSPLAFPDIVLNVADILGSA